MRFRRRLDTALTVTMPLALTFAPVPAMAGTVRALFVGIDHYRYSTAHVPDANFADLRGAVGDVGRIKQALHAAYGLDLDTPAAGQCQSANAVSATLTDGCATRAAILSALERLIAASAPGDTLVFYYAGHGSQIIDDQLFEQASGQSDTILPVDARQPGAASDGDIIDRELRGYIDQATAKGVNVLTLFDSCHSASAPRAGRRERILGAGRHAPLLIAHHLVRPDAPALVGSGGGYRAHIGASQDYQTAHETAADSAGAPHGLFTDALVAAFGAMPHAAFADIAARVTDRVVAASDGRQRPHAEGALNATFGGPDRPVPLFDVGRGDGFVGEKGAPMLSGGQLSGVTEGSTFALFASASDALDNRKKPLAIATAGPPDTWGAPLRFAHGAPSLPLRVVARELAHAWGDGVLPVRIYAGTEGEMAQTRAMTRAMIGALPMVRVLDESQRSALPVTTITMPATIGATATVETPDGTKIDAGPGDSGLSARLGAILGNIARAQALLALASADGTGSSLCIAEGDYDVFACPPLRQGPVRTVAANADLKLTAANKGAAPRYLYVLLIDPHYAITLTVPRDHGLDDKVDPDLPQQRHLRLTGPGLYRFVTITSDRRINAAALERTGVSGHGAASTSNGWTARVTQVNVAGG